MLPSGLNSIALRALQTAERLLYVGLAARCVCLGRALMRHTAVLLVEDNQLLRWWMTSSLQREGWHVVAPESFEEAMNLADLCPFDALITDWRLANGHEGSEILAKVRQSYPETLAVLISAEADAGLTERARTTGFDLVIAKPFPVAEIVAAVQDLAVKRESKVDS